MRIIADTPALFSPEEGRSIGLSVVPACTVIDQKVYRDYVDISSDECVSILNAGAAATTSQPSIGDIVEVYENCDEEMLVLPIGDGLSGTYQNMVSAREMTDSSKRIHVLDTKTLAGPQHYLVRKAIQLRDQGLDIERIKSALQECIRTSASFVIPQDFSFLRRSGRLTPVAAKIGTVLKIVPIMTQTQDMKRITLFAIKRSRKKAVAALVDHFKSLGVNEKYMISVSHGGVKEEAMAVLEQLREHFASSVLELFSLPPSLMIHGGPGCIVIQTMMMRGD